jgi:membrane associated rhomboid family serine protease
METERKKFLRSLVFPSLFLIFLWLIRIFESLFSIDLGFLGIYPLKASGLIGIVTAPLVHASFAHLAANSIPLFVLSVGIFYFYREIAYWIFFLIYFMTGLWTWFFAREAYHLGASGLIYGFASFLFFSGLIRKDVRLSIVSFIVVFLYGGMVWGIFPNFMPEKNISWESHLMGMLAGLVLALYFRKYGPQRKKYDWEEDEEDEEEDENEDRYWEVPGETKEKKKSSGHDSGDDMKITYHYKPSPRKKQ